MYVVAKHRITDAESFFSASRVAAENAPAGVYGRQFCPSLDQTEAVCLWEADSVEVVERYLDSLIGQAGENTYFEVSSEAAIGVPQPIIGARRVSFETSRGNAAESYERYFVPVIGGPLAADLVELAAIRPGERVLDVACGTGVVTRLVAARTGAEGTVAGVDLNPGMLSVARAAPPADTAIDWYEARAETMPLPDEAFDVALCQLGLQFIEDKAAALGEMRRVLVPGGRLLISVAGPTPPIFAVLEAALARQLGPGVAAFVRAVFSLHDPSELGDLLADAGFTAVVARRSEKTLQLPPPDEFLWQYVESTPLAAAAADLDDDGRIELEREVVGRWRHFVEKGDFTLRQPITVATARK
jgi:ubiquinone/menaquinone biosynthesis C-methylase UbiE